MEEPGQLEPTVSAYFGERPLLRDAGMALFGIVIGVGIGYAAFSGALESPATNQPLSPTRQNIKREPPPTGTPLIPPKQASPVADPSISQKRLNSASGTGTSPANQPPKKSAAVSNSGLTGPIPPMLPNAGGSMDALIPTLPTQADLTQLAKKFGATVSGSQVLEGGSSYSIDASASQAVPLAAKLRQAYGASISVSDPYPLPQPNDVAAAQLSDAERKLVQLQQRKSSLLTDYYSDAPVVVNVEQEISATQKQIGALTKQIQSRPQMDRIEVFTIGK